VGPGESHADSYWLLEGTAPRVFLGDIVLHREHAYVSDGHTSEWLATLARLQTELRGVQQLYPGHGPAGGLELLTWQADYLRAYRSAVDALRAGQPSLSDAAKQELSTRMKALYPEAGIDFLIPLGADAVAAELATQRHTESAQQEP
jgi:glyoxylase-like metal-dependent hydrolase (beta-lactamase superfamily II)